MMANSARFMVIDHYFDSYGNCKWAVVDDPKGEGIRAVTLGLGPHWRRLKKAASVLMVLLLITWLSHPERLFVWTGGIVYVLWVLEMANANKQLLCTEWS